VPDVSAVDAESPVVKSSDVAQAESSDATNKNRTMSRARRLFTRERISANV